MNTTRALALPVIAVMAATLLAGCGDTKGNATPAAPSPSAMMSEDAMMSDKPAASEDAMMSDKPAASEDAMMSEDAEG